MSKVFVIDVAKCNGCHNCQIACKDEHCEQAWMPYSEAQPETGQFWVKVIQTERGQVPFVRLSYKPIIGAQTEAVREYAPEVCQEREDGLIVIDPVKAKGREDIAEKFEGVYWNEELGIPQGCAGCAHLLADGWTVPRCADACPTDAIKFGDEEDFAAEIAEAKADPNGWTEGSKVYYLNVPKRFVAATIVDFAIDEVVIGARVNVYDADGGIATVSRTDDFGDFFIDGLEPGKYVVEVEEWGYRKLVVDVDLSEKDIFIGDLSFEKR